MGFFLFVSLSPFHLSISPPAWGFVGQGSNMHSRSSYSVNPPKVIVSRSHSGKVKSYIQDAFGNSTTVIEAGGAGEWRTFEHRYITCKSIAWCRWSSKNVWSKQTVNYRNCEFDRLSALDTFLFLARWMNVHTFVWLTSHTVLHWGSLRLDFHVKDELLNLIKSWSKFKFSSSNFRTIWTLRKIQFKLQFSFYS